MFMAFHFPVAGLLSLTLVAAVGAMENGSANSPEKIPENNPNVPNKKPKEDPFAVVSAGSELKAVKMSEIAELQKKADEKYAEDLKAFNEAKKEAAKARRAFNKPQPQKLKIEVLGFFKTEEEAKGFYEKAVEKKLLADPYVVLEAGQELKIMKKSAIADFEKNLERQYKVDLKAYEEAKQAAGNRGKQFVKEKPVKVKIKVLSASFKSQAEAEAHVQKVKAEKKKPKNKDK